MNIKLAHKYNIKRVLSQLSKIKHFSMNDFKKRWILISSILIILTLVLSATIFLIANNKEEKVANTPKLPQTKTIIIENTETEKEEPIKFQLYENATLSYSSYYPDSFIKVAESTSYPQAYTIFANNEKCAEYSANNDSDNFEINNCFMIYIWENYGQLEVECYQNDITYRSVNDKEKRNVRISTCDDDHTITDTFKYYKYKKGTNSLMGELVVQTAYAKSYSEKGKNITDQIVSNFISTNNWFVPFEPEGINEDIPMVIVSKNRNNLFIFKDKKITRLAAPELGDIIWPSGKSPDGKKFAYVFFDYENDTNNTSKFTMMWGPYFTGIGITNIDSPNTNNVILPSGKKSYGHLSWSPDGRYLSYIVNNGESLVMFDTQTNKEVFSYTEPNFQGFSVTDKGARPLTWINNDEFSFAFNGILYLGTIDNPMKTVLFNEVASANNSFESPIILTTPKWSTDKRYVYISLIGGKSVILDITTSRYYYFGGPAVLGMGGPSSSVNEIGWTKDDKFIYTDLTNDGKIKMLSFMDNLMNSEDIDLPNSDYDSNTVMTSDGSLLVESTYNSIISYDTTSKRKICENNNVNNFYGTFTSQDKTRHYAIIDINNTGWSPWSNTKNFKPINDIIEIYDTDTCKTVGGITIDGGIDSVYTLEK